MERPGRIVERLDPAAAQHGRRREKELDLAQLDPDGPEMRPIRGGEIGLVFQEPMTSFSPVHTIGNQIIETIRLHSAMTRRRSRASGRSSCCAWSASPSRSGAIDEYAFELSGGCASGP